MTYIDQAKLEQKLFGEDEQSQLLILSAEEAAVARNLLGKLLDRKGSAPAGTSLMQAEDLQSMAKGIYISRKKRSDYLGAALFSEHAWDMLLVLYIYGDRGERMSVTRLAEFSEVPLTTAIRWLDYLESQRLILREQCPTDRRKFLVQLSPKGRTTLENYLSDVFAASKQRA